MDRLSLPNRVLLAAALSLAPLSLSAAGKLVQVGVLDGLMQGALDGEHSIEVVQREDALGIGTFDKLDGEMVVLDGLIYRIAGDGTVSRPSLDEKTPFAASVAFDPEIFKTLGELDGFKAFVQECDQHLVSRNHPHAIRLTGRFSYVKTRSVPAQKMPYPTLPEITAEQATFEFKDIEGTMVGFYCPEYMRGINVPGYHLHFITKDKKGGGHVLDFQASGLDLALQSLTGFQILLPGTDSTFSDTDLTPFNAASSGGLKDVFGTGAQ